MFTAALQDAQRELKGLEDQLQDAHTRQLRLQKQAGPLVRTLDNVRRKVETYGALKNQLQVCRTVLNATQVVPHTTVVEEQGGSQSKAQGGQREETLGGETPWAGGRGATAPYRVSGARRPVSGSYGYIERYRADVPPDLACKSTGLL